MYIKSFKVLTISIIVLFSLVSFTSNTNSQKWFTKTGKVSFFSKTTVEDISAVNNQSTFVFDEGNGDISSKIAIKSFIFKKKLMQEHFNENYMESTKYPEATFKGKIDKINLIDLSKDTTYNVTCSGNLTMHGVTNKVSVSNGKMIAKGGKTVTLTGTLSVKLADYKIDRPAAVKDKISESITINIESACAKFNK